MGRGVIPMIVKYVDLTSLCIITSILILSYTDTELYEIYAFVSISTLGAWAFCMVMTGAPARWGSIMSNKLALAGLTIYNILLAFISIGGIIPVLGMQFYDIVPLVIGANISVFRVLVPMCVLLVNKIHKTKILNI